MSFQFKICATTINKIFNVLKLRLPILHNMNVLTVVFVFLSYIKRIVQSCLLFFC